MEGNLIIPIKIKVYIPFDPGFVLLEIYSSNVFIHVQIDMCLFWEGGRVGSSLLRAVFLELHQVGATLCCGARASHCGDFSCCGAQALGTWASVVVARGL